MSADVEPIFTTNLSDLEAAADDVLSEAARRHLLAWAVDAASDGIVILDWSRAFDRLRDAPRIAMGESLLPLYKQHMRPCRMPEVFGLDDEVMPENYWAQMMAPLTADLYLQPVVSLPQRSRPAIIR